MIEKRPDIVDTRERFGDWEIDTVNGLRVGKDQALLTLTERKTRYEIIIKIDGKAANPVDRALTALKKLRATISKCFSKRLLQIMVLNSLV
nr:hypothetical protein [Enterococcus avium]